MASEPMFFGEFHSIADISETFGGTDEYSLEFQGNEPTADCLRDGDVLLVAVNSQEDYCGYAWVLFERDGKLFEVHGSHCSCHGFEGQWKPEETTFQALRDRVTNGGYIIASLDDGSRPVATEAESAIRKWLGTEGSDDGKD